METGTGRSHAVNDGHADLSDAVGVGAAAGIDPSGFVAFFLGSAIDHFNEFLGGVRAGHGRRLGNARGFNGDAVAPILLGQSFDAFVDFAAVFVVPAAGVDLKGALFRNRVADRTAFDNADRHARALAFEVLKVGDGDREVSGSQNRAAAVLRVVAGMSGHTVHDHIPNGATLAGTNEGTCGAAGFANDGALALGSHLLEPFAGGKRTDFFVGVVAHSDGQPIKIFLAGVLESVEDRDDTGLAVGAGFYECVLIAFAMIFLSIRLFPIVDAYIQENARDINLYMEFYSLGDISTIINQLKSQNVQIYDIDIERNKSGEALHPSAIFSIRLNEKIPHTQLLSDLAELDCFCVIEEL